jgi:hypothetical protein
MLPIFSKVKLFIQKPTSPESLMGSLVDITKTEKIRKCHRNIIVKNAKYHKSANIISIRLGVKDCKGSE